MTERVGQAEPSTGGPAAARLRPLRSVRVRITLAAALVTAVAIATAGWLLVWSVEDSQLGAIRDHTEDLLDRVTERLAAGVPPERTVHPRELTTSFVEIVYEDGTSIKLVPTYYLSDGASDEVGVRTFREGPGSSEPAPSDGIVADSPTPTIRMPIVSARTVDTPAGEVTVTVAAPVDQVARSCAGRWRSGFPSSWAWSPWRPGGSSAGRCARSSSSAPRPTPSAHRPCIGGYPSRAPVTRSTACLGP
jgi:hypothetical protein